MRRRHFCGGNTGAYNELLRAKGYLEPFAVYSLITGEVYEFDKEFLAKVDLYLGGERVEFSPKEKELLNAFISYADGGGGSPVLAALDVAILEDME